LRVAYVGTTVAICIASAILALAPSRDEGISVDTKILITRAYARAARDTCRYVCWLEREGTDLEGRDNKQTIKISLAFCGRLANCALVDAVRNLKSSVLGGVPLM